MELPDLKAVFGAALARPAGSTGRRLPRRRRARAVDPAPARDATASWSRASSTAPTRSPAIPPDCARDRD